MASKHSTPLILLTGFEPFENDPINPAWEIARALDGEVIAGATVCGVELPCVFGDSIARLDEAIAQVRPVLIVSLGFAGNRNEITPERVAINLDDARIPDNAGQQPVDTPVVPGGPAAYFSSLPVKAMLQGVLRAGVPCEVSQTAGTFVCNHVLYGLLHLLQSQGGDGAGVRGGFVHVPWLPDQGAPHLALRDMVRGIHAALWAAVLTTHDIALGAGATH